jgi:hypothetical protein
MGDASRSTAVESRGTAGFPSCPYPAKTSEVFKSSALFDQDQRIDVEYPSMRREVTPNVARHIDASDPGEGVVIYSQ